MKGLVLTSDDFANQIVQTCSELYRNNLLTDVTLVCDDKVKIFAHKIVLSAGSSFFRDFFVTNVHEKPLLYLKGIRQQHLLPLLQFMYNGEATIYEDILNEVLAAAQDLEIVGLKDQLANDYTDDVARNEERKRNYVKKENTNEQKFTNILPSNFNETKSLDWKDNRINNDIDIVCLTCGYGNVSAFAIIKHTLTHENKETKVRCTRCLQDKE